MKRSSTALAALAVALVTALGAGAGNGTPINNGSANRLDLAVIGDLPYNAAQVAAFPAWVDEIDRDPEVDLVVHLGDIKSGSTTCDNAYFLQIAGFFDAFKDPLVYTPGDNEWTDCHRANNGADDPLERLDKLREIFFPEPGVTDGGRKKHVLAQPGYPENVLWMQSKAVFSAPDVVGSNNSLVPWTGLSAPTVAQLAEANARIAATLAWIDETFETAEDNGARGVVLLIQADTFELDNENLAGFTDILARIEARSAAFDGPVLLLQGDSHQFVADKPFAGARNITRIVVEGSATGDEWLKLSVDPRSSAFFSWERIPF